MKSGFGLAWTLGLSVMALGAATGCETTIDTTGGAGGGASTNTSTNASTTSTSTTGNTTTTSSSTGGGPTADEACAAHATALCALRDSCSNGFFTERDYGDLAACEARQKEECLLRLEAPGTSLDVAQLVDCAGALPTFACADFLNAELPSACGPKPGAVADGGACAVGAQCASTYCMSPSDQACGTCAPAPKAGDSCADDTGCGAGAGLRCAPTSGLCVVPGQVGAACVEDQECRNELSCVVPTAGMPGTCQTAGAAVGAACDAQAKTAPDCDRNQGLRCNAGQCAAVTFAGNGEACGGTIGAVCEANGNCLGASGMKTCIAAVADGVACDREAGPPCEAPAHCYGDGTSTAGVCGLPAAAACM